MRRQDQVQEHVKATGLSLQSLLGTAHGERFWQVLLGYYSAHLIEALASDVSSEMGESALLSGLVPPTDRAFVHDSRREPVAGLSFTKDATIDDLLRRLRVNTDAPPMGGLAYRALLAPSSVSFYFRGHLGGRSRKAAQVGKYRELLELSARTRTIVAPPPRRRPPGARSARWERQVRIDLRHQLHQDLLEQGLSERLARATAVSLPTSFLEDFPKGFATPKPPKVGFVGNPPWWFEERILLAKWAEAGSRVTFVQHGGRYGQSDPTPSEVYERQVADSWIDWWTPVDGIGYLPSLRLSALVGASGPRSRRKSDAILWMTSLDWDSPSGSGEDRSSNASGSLASARNQFWNRLESGARDKLRLRGRPAKFGREPVREMYPEGAKRSSSGLPALQAMLGSSLVVVEGQFATALFEAIALDIPVICYEIGRLSYADTWNPIAQELHDLRILHVSAASAAEEVNSAARNVEDWWRTRRDDLDALLPACRQFDGAMKRWARYLHLELERSK